MIFLGIWAKIFMIKLNFAWKSIIAKIGKGRFLLKWLLTFDATRRSFDYICTRKEVCCGVVWFWNTERRLHLTPYLHILCLNGTRVQIEANIFLHSGFGNRLYSKFFTIISLQLACVFEPLKIEHIWVKGYLVHKKEIGVDVYKYPIIGYLLLYLNQLKWRTIYLNLWKNTPVSL